MTNTFPSSAHAPERLADVHFAWTDGARVERVDGPDARRPGLAGDLAAALALAHHTEFRYLLFRQPRGDGAQPWSLHAYRHRAVAEVDRTWAAPSEVAFVFDGRADVDRLVPATDGCGYRLTVAITLPVAEQAADVLRSASGEGLLRALADDRRVGGAPDDSWPTAVERSRRFDQAATHVRAAISTRSRATNTVLVDHDALWLASAALHDLDQQDEHELRRAEIAEDGDPVCVITAISDGQRVRRALAQALVDAGLL